ncbi:YqcC family protein [Flavitalea flava]
MKERGNPIIAKTEELEEELKKNGLWEKEMPSWVDNYEGNSRMIHTDFAQWLQFVFVPNHLELNKIIPSAEKKLIVPQAMKYFGEDLKKGKLLQILIELDSLI